MTRPPKYSSLSFFLLSNQITEAGSHEAGWYHGELNGRSGWFPESYVELVSADEAAAYPTDATAFAGDSSVPSTAPGTADIVNNDAFADAFAPIAPEPSTFEPSTDGFK